MAYIPAMPTDEKSVMDVYREGLFAHALGPRLGDSDKHQPIKNSVTELRPTAARVPTRLPGN